MITRRESALLEAATRIDHLIGEICYEVDKPGAVDPGTIRAALEFTADDGLDSPRPVSVTDIVSSRCSILAGVEEDTPGVQVIWPRQLAALESTLVDLRRAIRWAARVPTFNWWIENRLSELAIPNRVIIPSPGRIGQFELEMTSFLGLALQEVSQVLAPSPRQLAAAERIRRLSVPRGDGASPKWHPITLGHELAHLRFSSEEIVKWMATQEFVDGTAGAIGEAIKASRRVAQDAYLAHWLTWFRQSIDRLAETACDAVMLHYYGEGGVAALHTHLDAFSGPSDGPEHPNPRLRLAVLSGKSGDDLTQYLEAGDFNKQAEGEIYRYFAPKVCEWVRDQLGISRKDLKRAATVREGALVDLDACEVPNSSAWTPELFRTSGTAGEPAVLTPSLVEAALISAYWGARGAFVENDAGRLMTMTKLGAETGFKGDVERLAFIDARCLQAIDFLQFAFGFHEAGRRAEANARERGEQPKRVKPPNNVLYVTSSGVTTSRGADNGLASMDVRLGRYFIVFKRNQIESLDTLNAGHDLRRIQEPVEVAWGESFTLHPGELVLGVTIESLVVADDCVAQVLSRSSLGRLGLLAATAVQVHPKFTGCLTLELVNLASVPLALTPGQRIAQIVPAASCGNPDDDDSHYQFQGPRPVFSAVAKDRDHDVLELLFNQPRLDHGGLQL
jgi:deoxycytidine triphosphate deaminase